ncbi:MAG: hypothetical protein PHR61_03140 [Candidatus Absconditabacteria bacterium]|nr:hypothetical protein [Candidatus Absconditabacteria bacterium]
MKTIHVAVNCSGEKTQIWVAPRMCELSNVFGHEFVSYHKKAPSALENFLKANQDMEQYFYKGFAYWVICGVYGIKEIQNQYGILKRRLKEFNKKLFRAIRSLADKIAREIRKNF